MATSIRLASLSREKDDCFLLDDGFAADRDTESELSADRFRLLDPRQSRVDERQPSALGELFRERINFGPAYCDGTSPYFRGFRIDVDHEACVVQVTVRIALAQPDRLLHVPDEVLIGCGGDPLALLARRRAGGGLAPWDESCEAGIRRYLQERIEAKKPGWKRVIEETWSEKFALYPIEFRGGVSPSPQGDNPLTPWREDLVWTRNTGRDPISNCESYPIRVAVEWVDAESLVGGDVGSSNWDSRVDYRVSVQFGASRDSMRYWHLDMREATVAHEFGHMLGNPDEYDGTCDGCPHRPVVDGSIMNNHVIHPEGVMAHHFFLVSYWMWSRTCSAYRIGRLGWHARGGGMDLGDPGVVLVDIGSWYQRNIDCP